MRSHNYNRHHHEINISIDPRRLYNKLSRNTHIIFHLKITYAQISSICCLTKYRNQKKRLFAFIYYVSSEFTCVRRRPVVPKVIRAEMNDALEWSVIKGGKLKFDRFYSKKCIVLQSYYGMSYPWAPHWLVLTSLSRGVQFVTPRKCRRSLSIYWLIFYIYQISCVTSHKIVLFIS